jgi:ribosome biogenesis GTPase
MLDRFLALAEIDHIHSLIVINKIDLGIDESIERALAEYERIGYPVLRTSTRDGSGIAALRDALSDRISAVVGPSGVGKSSLLNAVEPGLQLREGEVSQALHKGRHTTRVGELHPLSGGGLVADTPGLREIGLWELDPGELEFAFVEFQPFLHHCRYPDCSHTHEPGCAVRAAVDDGAITAERHASYAAMLAAEQ